MRITVCWYCEGKVIQSTNGLSECVACGESYGETERDTYPPLIEEDLKSYEAINF